MRSTALVFFLAAMPSFISAANPAKPAGGKHEALARHVDNLVKTGDMDAFSQLARARLIDKVSLKDLRLVVKPAVDRLIPPGADAADPKDILVAYPVIRALHRIKLLENRRRCEILMTIYNARIPRDGSGSPESAWRAIDDLEGNFSYALEMVRMRKPLGRPPAVDDDFAEELLRMLADLK